MLSMKAKYALRALLLLAQENCVAIIDKETPQKMLASKAIAQMTGVPLKFLEAILQQLRQAGIVDSKRGIFGGFFLARPADKIIVGQIIRCIDGHLAPIRCASLTAYQKCDDCVDEISCTIRKTMLDVRNAISDVLDGRTLADMAQLEQNAKYAYGDGI